MPEHVTDHAVLAQHGKQHYDSKRYLTWTKLTRVTAWIKVVLYNSQSLKKHRNIVELLADEATNSETHLTRSLQQDRFADE